MENKLRYVIYAVILSSLFCCTSCNEEEKVAVTDEKVAVRLSVGGVIEPADSDELGQRSSDDQAPVRIVRPFGEHYHLIGTFEKEETKTSTSRAAQPLKAGVKCRFFAYNVDSGTIDQSVDFTVGGEMPTVMVAQGVKYLFYAYSYNVADDAIAAVDVTGAPNLLLLPFREGTGELLYWIDNGERIFTANNTERVELSINFKRACSRIKVKLYGDALQVNSGRVELKLQSEGFFKLRNLTSGSDPDVFYNWQGMTEIEGGSVEKEFDCSRPTEATAEFFLIPQQLYGYTTFTLSDVSVAGYPPQSGDIKLNYIAVINMATSYTFKIKIVPNSSL